MTNEQAIETLKHYPCVCKYGTSPIKCTDTECDFGKAIRTLTVDVAPTVEERPKGKWELLEKKPYINLYMCSKCGHIIESMPDRLAENFKGCYCGADMRGEEE